MGGGTGRVADGLHREHGRHFPTSGVACRLEMTHAVRYSSQLLRLHFYSRRMSWWKVGFHFQVLRQAETGTPFFITHAVVLLWIHYDQLSVWSPNYYYRQIRCRKSIIRLLPP